MTATKINVTEIVRDHFATMRTQRGNLYLVDLGLFFILPFVVAVAMVAAGMLVLTPVSSILVTSLSIFAGLLFNLLILILNMGDQSAAIIEQKGPSRMRRLHRELLSEVYANVAYGILVSIVTVVLVFLLETAAPVLKADAPASTAVVIIRLVSAIIFFLTGNFVSTLFMVLKRMHALLRRDLN